MEKKTTKTIKLVALALLTVVLAFCSIFIITAQDASETVNALTTTTASGELLINPSTGNADSSGKVFNSNSLTKLYEALGGTGATYNSLYSAVVTGSTNKTSADFRANNTTSSNVTVTFGGQNFYAMYLTKDKTNSNLVLTLWTTTDYYDASNKFNDIYSISTSGNYPSSMYGISKVRASLLSGDGVSRQYWKGNTTSTPGSLGNTMSSVTNLGNKFKLYTTGLKQYLFTPAEVAYQETESAYSNSAVGYNCSNDAYGAVGNTNFTGSIYNFYNLTSVRNLYTQWKDDAIWLPSVAETGSADATNQNGIWKTTAAIRKSSSASNYLGLRSSYQGSWADNILLNSSGSTFMNSGHGVGEAYYVRPAMHLNLTLANSKSKKLISAPSDMEVTYNGNSRTLSSIATEVGASWYNSTDYAMTGSSADFLGFKVYETPQGGTENPTPATSFPSARNAAKYRIVCTIKDTANCEWRDPSTGAMAGTADKTFYVTIKQKEVNYTWKSATYTPLGSSWSTDFSQAIFSDHTLAPRVYLDYSLLSADNGKNGSTDKTVPHIELKIVNNDGFDSDVTAINDRSAAARGTNFPYHAGSYTVSFTDKNSATSNYKLIPGSGQSATRPYTINKMSLSAPGDKNAVYDGTDKTFTAPEYKADFMDYGSNSGSAFTAGGLPTDNSDPSNARTLTLDTSSLATLAFKGTDAGVYKIYYKPKTFTDSSGGESVRDYQWTDGSTDIKEVTYTLRPRTLAFAFASSTSGGGFSAMLNDNTSKISVDYLSGYEPITRDGASAPDAVEYELWYYFGSETVSAALPNPGSVFNEILYKDLKNSSAEHKSGGYVVFVKLKDVSACAENANYTIDTNAANYAKDVTLRASVATLDDIKLMYKSSIMDVSDLPLLLPYTDPGMGTKNLQYAFDVNGNCPVQYFPMLDFTDINFLELVGDYTYKYSDGTMPNAGEGFARADTVTVEATVQVVAGRRDDNKMPLLSEYTGTKFTYTRIDDTQGTLSFIYTIDKGDIDPAAISSPALQWRFGGDTSWNDYDVDNPPEYTGRNIEVQIKQPYPNGVISATTDTYLGDRKNPGAQQFSVTYTVSTDNYNTVGTKTYSIEISSQVIDMGNVKGDYYRDAGGNNVTDSFGAPYQIRVLNLSDPAYADFISYEYYTVDLSSGSPQPGVLIGTDDTALSLLTDPNGTYAASSINPVRVFVRPVLAPNAPTTPSGKPRYVLKDKSGTTITNDATGENGFVLFMLGENKDSAIVTKNKTESVYGDSVNKADIFSIKLADGSPLPENLYISKIYRDTVAASNDLGILGDFDFASANAGRYVITIELIAEDSYILTDPTIEFTVNKKEIALPEIGEIPFTGDVTDVTGYLGGSYATYKDIIRLSGDTQGRNVLAGGYVLHLTLTDGNYKWAVPDSGEVAAVMFMRALFAESIFEVTSDDVAKVTWNISPIVMDASEMWNMSGQSGASLNLPENIRRLIDAGTLTVNYRYYDDAGNPLEEVEFAGGKSYKVEAILTGTDADDYKNVVFVANGEYVASSGQTTYTVPQGGIAAFFGNVLGFMQTNWLWFAIGLGALLLLILLIILVKRHKKKKAARMKAEAEEREKAEEKKRREEEREERRLDREARYAMQQPVMPPVQAVGVGMQPVQPQPAQSQSVQSAPVQTQNPQYAPPVNMPAAQSGMMHEEMLAKIDARFDKLLAEQQAAKEVAAAKAEATMIRLEAAQQIAAARMEAEFAKMKAENNIVHVQHSNPSDGKSSMEAFGELVMTALKQLNGSKMPNIVLEEDKPALPESNFSGNVVPGAITTTTTTTTVDASGRTEEKSSVAANTDAIPEAEGLFNRRGRGKDKSYDPDNFYNFFDEQEDKK